MPRRQRFKPSRKPKPAIEPSENEIVQPSRARSEQDPQELNAGQHEDRERHPDSAEDRIGS
jgi:hypothetical protein